MKRSFKKTWTVLLTLLALIFNAVGVTPAYAATTWTVTSLADDGTAAPGNCPHAANCRLSDAIAAASDGDTIIFGSGLSGGIIHLAASLDLSKTLTIDGSALSSEITISGDTDNDGIGNVRIFYIYSNVSTPIVTLKNFKIIKGTYQLDGGAIRNRESLSATNITFSGNSTGWNGGAIINDGTLTVTDSTFSGNSANWGGAISNYGTLIVKNSAFYGNHAGTKGGAIDDRNATITVANSTFSGNYADQGGAMFVYSVTLTNSTFSGNIATNGNGGGIYIYGGPIHFSNNIIANSTGSDCLYTGTFITNTNNLIEDGSCLASLSGDPKLAALADNGGPTKTMGLLSGSPAIDAGNDAVCAAAPVNNVDQRGVTRPAGAHCDIGAYEGTVSTINVNLKSVAANDGWILESGEKTGRGGAKNSTTTTFNLGDDATNKQYRGILHFNASLPAGAIVTSATLKIKKNVQVGANINLFAKFGGLLVDTKKPGFGAPALAVDDFQAAGTLNVAKFGSAPVGGWYSAPIGSASINPSGATQFRLRFKLDDNNDFLANYLKFYSGSAGANSPQLVIEYYVP